MLSFCIPAHNEEAFLPAAIGAIRESAQRLGEGAYEIVVADDASNDRTAAVAQGLGARVISIDRRQIAAARNAAARAARGDLLFFVDADTCINEVALAEAVAILKRGGAGGCPVRFDGEIPRYGRMLLPLVTGFFRLLRLSGGASMFCTRAAFDATGGWDETLFASEEITFARELKRRGRFSLTRAAVVTSGRKMRTHTARELFGPLIRLALAGPRAVRRREGLDLWYAPRRPDPRPGENQRDD